MELSERERYMLAKLGEEAAELAAACSKLLAKPTKRRVKHTQAEAGDVLGMLRLNCLVGGRIADMAAVRVAREFKRAPR